MADLLSSPGPGEWVLLDQQQRRLRWRVVLLLRADQVAGGPIPRCLIERVEALLRGAPLPRQRRQWQQVRGRLIRA